MRKLRNAILAVAVVAPFIFNIGPASAGLIAESTFDTDPDGWTLDTSRPTNPLFQARNISRDDKGVGQLKFGAEEPVPKVK